MIEADKCKIKFNPEDVYSIEKVKAHKWERIKGYVDWAWVQLDRPVVGRVPLKIDFSSVKASTELYMLGHPTGLPVKLARNAKVKKKDHKDYFEADLDAFKGNSGSPVFNKKNE